MAAPLKLKQRIRWRCFRRWMRRWGGSQRIGSSAGCGSDSGAAEINQNRSGVNSTVRLAFTESLGKGAIPNEIVIHWTRQKHAFTPDDEAALTASCVHQKLVHGRNWHRSPYPHNPQTVSPPRRLNNLTSAPKAQKANNGTAPNRRVSRCSIRGHSSEVGCVWLFTSSF